MSDLVSPDIHPLKKAMFPALSGRSKRKLNRQNTVHWTGVCPSCGSKCQFYKEYGNKFNGTLRHNVWVCKNSECRSVYTKVDFKEGRYI